MAFVGLNRNSLLAVFAAGCGFVADPAGAKIALAPPPPGNVKGKVVKSERRIAAGIASAAVTPIPD